MREKIVSEIKRIAAEAGGRAPGRAIFEKYTGIKYHEWYGVYWSRWSDALAEAGFEPNKLQLRYDRDAVLAKIAQACLALQKFATVGEMRLYSRANDGFPSHSTISAHFRDRPSLLDALHDWAKRTSSSDILALLPEAKPLQIHTVSPRTEDGWVYLIRSGAYYKVGRSAQIERRIKEIKIALPDAADMVHAIATDDPVGIEAYWHKRFAKKRANGEWFKLESVDISAFKRRKFQ